MWGGPVCAEPPHKDCRRWPSPLFEMGLPPHDLAFVKNMKCVLQMVNTCFKVVLDRSIAAPDMPSYSPNWRSLAPKGLIRAEGSWARGGAYLVGSPRLVDSSPLYLHQKRSVLSDKPLNTGKGVGSHSRSISINVPLSACFGVWTWWISRSIAAGLSSGMRLR